MSHILAIAQLGHPVLREIARRVEQHQEVKSLADDMLVTVADANGVGLAAPQVYHSERVMLIASRPNSRYPKAPVMLPTIMINPELCEASTEQEYGWEGCLSIPGIRGWVPRATTIQVRYETLTGTLVEKTLDGFVARIFLHELDHLDGFTFLDRLDSNRDIISEKEYLKKISTN